MLDVVLVRWPEESEHLDDLRTRGVPRLLLVGPESPPPDSIDTLEDWVRLPAADPDVRARVATLEMRASSTVSSPEIDVDGLLRYRDRWVSLSPVESLIARVLAERLDAVVSRELLIKRAWPNGAPTRNALDVHVLRLRRRITPLGLEIRTVRSRGYLLQAMAHERATVAT